ncbi:hypothetical protein GQR58_008038 [Nymphon striatum]|nr:hypothetical protein GQR58_008038 [Nymphon striatum]
MPACAEVNNAMQLLTGVNYNTGEQNKDIAIDRQVRDMKDTHTIISYLQERTPFSSDPSLDSISTGVRATSTVNVDSAKIVGTAILTNMDGQTATDYKFKRKDQAITLAAKSAVKIDSEAVQKPVLADAIWTLLTDDAPGITDQVHYVLDGGALVQRIPWARGSTYKGICRQYTEYVTKKYGQATVVFDGYDGASTKNTTHQRRMRGNAGATVMFDEDMQVTMKKPKKKVKKPRVWNMKYVKQQLGPDVSQHVFFMHALLGCDITSQVYGIGKGASLKKFKTSAHFRDQANVFDRQAASTDDVIEAGEKALACLYNGNPGESLNVVRHKRFCQKVASNTSHVQPQSLPPTSAAAKHHSLRVYYQVQQWKGIAANELRPCDWGWQKSSSGLVPVQTDLPPAPKELLKMIRCNCQTDCSSLKCTCKKHDIECSAACADRSVDQALRGKYVMRGVHRLLATIPRDHHVIDKHLEETPLSEEVKASLAKLRHLIDAQELADEHAELERNAELKDLLSCVLGSTPVSYIGSTKRQLYRRVAEDAERKANEQNRNEESSTRIHSDGRDRDNLRRKIALCFDLLNPNEHPPEIVIVVTGQVASPSVNAHESVKIETLATMNKHVPVGCDRLFGTELIFSRIIGVHASTSSLNLQDPFSYELAPVPTSMFKESGDIRIMTVAYFIAGFKNLIEWRLRHGDVYLIFDRGADGVVNVSEAPRLECNHPDADTRIFLHAFYANSTCQQPGDIVVRMPDSVLPDSTGLEDEDAEDVEDA